MITVAKQYDFTNFSDQELLLMEEEVDRQLNEKLMRMVYDEELEQLYKQSERILQERRQRGLTKNGKAN
ncbi:MAG: hypothetical protein ACOCV1_07770 [Bacillota bacterium]